MDDTNAEDLANQFHENAELWFPTSQLSRVISAGSNARFIIELPDGRVIVVFVEER